MNTAAAYYKMIQVIKTCKTMDHILSCERLINSMRFRFTEDLATLALIKKCELIAQHYPVTE